MSNVAVKPSHKKAATDFTPTLSNANSVPSIPESEKEKIPEGMKIDEKSGELRVMTEVETRIKFLLENVALEQKRSRQLEDSNKLLPLGELQINVADFKVESETDPGENPQEQLEREMLTEVVEVEVEDQKLLYQSHSMINVQNQELGASPKTASNARTMALRQGQEEEGSKEYVLASMDSVEYQESMPVDTQTSEMLLKGLTTQSNAIITNQSPLAKKIEQKFAQDVDVLTEQSSSEEGNEEDKEQEDTRQIKSSQQEILVVDEPEATLDPGVVLPMAQHRSTKRLTLNHVESGEFLDLVNEIPNWHKLPLIVQGQLRALIKPSKERTERDLAKLRPVLNECEFFKSKKLNEKTINSLIASAGFEHVPKGEFVFKEGDKGDCMYVLLQGSAEALMLNSDFREIRRGFYMRVKTVYDLIEASHKIDASLKAIEERDNDDKNQSGYANSLTDKLENIKKVTKLRTSLLKDYNQLRKMLQYRSMKSYAAGTSFGELALINSSPRQLAIAATRACYMLTINKNDYKTYLDKAVKKQREQSFEFFKNVPFLSGLSNQSLQKLEYAFKLETMEKAGQVIIKEGAPVDHIIIVKEGEFEVVKENLKALDDRILTFLKGGDIRKKIARQVMLLPGRTSIYQKTNQLFPVHEKNVDNSFMQDKSIDIEQLAFNSVSDQLVQIAKQQADKQARQTTSLSALKISGFDRYKNIRISIHGKGFTFGEYDAFTGLKQNQYTVRASRAGAQCFVMQKQDFMRACKQYAYMGDNIANTVHGRDMEVIRQLTRVVFSKWYTDLLQENLKVVPDLDPPSSKKNKNDQVTEAYTDPSGSQQQSEARARSRSPGMGHKKGSLGLDKPSAEDIIERAGSKNDIKMFRMQQSFQQAQMRKKVEASDNMAQVNQQASAHVFQKLAQPKTSEGQAEKPREKLQSQLHTLMPMEIVRAQPFFSQSSHILRDQIEEYVHGLPATRGHREIIAKTYNMKTYELNKQGQEVYIKDGASPQDRQESTIQPKSGARKKDEIDIMIPDQDLPVDPARLKKAIRTALIKNDNNPDKIDIQSIMREQVRIHKHIQEFKSSKSKPSQQSNSGNSNHSNQYFSSRIVQKIAEDHIHQTLKQLQAKGLDQQASGGTEQQQMSPQQKQQKILEREQPSPTKFQKLLAQKYNQNFKSVLERSKTHSNEITKRSHSVQSKYEGHTEVETMVGSRRESSVVEGTIQMCETPPRGDSQDRVFNRISHRKLGLQSNFEMAPKAIQINFKDSAIRQIDQSQDLSPNPTKMRSSYSTTAPLNGVRQSKQDSKNITFFSNAQFSQVKGGNLAYKAEAFLYQSKQGVAQLSARKKAMLKNQQQQAKNLPSIHLTTRYGSMRGEERNYMNNPLLNNRKKSQKLDSRSLAGNFSIERMQKQAGSSQNKRIQLAALFQPKSSKKSLVSGHDTTNYSDHSAIMHNGSRMSNYFNQANSVAQMSAHRSINSLERHTGDAHNMRGIPLKGGTVKGFD